MDGQRFDHLVRVLASGPSRRRLLQNLAMGALALLASGNGHTDTATARGCYKKKKRCRDHHQCCSGRCRHGWCKGGKRNEPCQPGQALCDSLCVDVQTDPQNCGACGISCAAGTGCCGGACLDVQSDPQSCGACGQACGAGTLCCGGACADLQTDAENCGACGQTCGAGTCCGGACRDVQTDPQNCGACGARCENGAVCVAGGCLCPEGTRDCNGRCIALDACCGVCIVLAWGETPVDLDAHGWTPDGTEVYFSAKGTVEAFPWMELDVDDITSFGPEQISISRLLPGQTSYAVQNFKACQGTEESSLAGSGATVRVTRDGEDLGEFTAPETGEGVWWNVVQFDEDGTMTVIDEISDTPPRPSAITCVADASLARGVAISKEASVPEERNAGKRRDRRKRRNR